MSKLQLLALGRYSLDLIASHLLIDLFFVCLFFGLFGLIGMPRYFYASTLNTTAFLCMRYKQEKVHLLFRLEQRALFVYPS